MRFKIEKAKNLTSLHSPVAKNVLKMGIAKKVAGSGLNLEHLKRIFEEDGKYGLLNTFSYTNCNGQPRVTNTKKTLEELIIPILDFFLSCAEKA